MIDAAWISELVRSAAIGGVVSAAVGMTLVLTRRRHLAVTGDGAGPSHKIHAVRTCRIGGIAVLSGFGVALLHWAGFSGARAAPDPAFVALLLLALLPVAGSGLAEDLTKRIGPRQRLFWIALGASTMVATGHVTLHSVDVPALDALLAFSPFAAVFTVVACTGATNAFNLVDGLDGLLGGVALITLAAIGCVAARVGDATVLGIAALLAAAIVGWLPFNWPRARLFSGDGGAYAIGFVIAVLLLVLVQRNPQVSPWFGLTAAALPVWETLHSMWRRRSDGRDAMQADQGHLHQLVRLRVHWSLTYRALRSDGVWSPHWTPGHGPPPPVPAPNGACSPLLWALHAAVVVPGVVWFDDTGASILLFAGFATVYVLLHRRLSRSRIKYLPALAR